MASSFDINAAIQLQAPTNIDSIASSIQSKLTGIKANIDIGIPPGASTRITNLNNRLKTLIQNLKDVTQNATSAAAAIQAIGASLDGTSTRLSNLQSYLKAVSAGFVNIGRSVLPASDTIEKFGQQSALAARRFSAFTVAAGAIVGVVAGIKTGLSEAINFQQQIVKIGQITQQSTNNLKPLVDEVTRLGVTFGVSSKSLIEISNTLAQAGLSAKDTRAALEALAKTTLAPTFGDIKNTTEAAISSMAQFNIAASDFEKVFGSINSVAAAFAVEAQDLTTVITKTGGVFKTLSGDIDSPITQLNQLISLFTSVRQTTRESADTIATGFRTIFGRLERPQTLQFLEAMGVKLTDLKGNFIGVFPAVRELNRALSEIPSTSPEYAKIVEQIGGLRQISKVIPLIQQFPVALRALQVAQAGQNSLTVDASRSQEAFAQRLSKVKEEFLDLFRIISRNQVFTTLADGFLRTATAIAQITKALEPLIPLMTAYAAIKFVPAAAQFSKGFFNYFTTQGVAHRAQGGEIPHFSHGGYVPGHGTGDTVPAMLEPKEFVIKQSSTAKVAKNYPGVLEYINKYGVLPQRKTTGDEISKYLQKLQDSTRQSSGTEIEYRPNELRDLKLLRSLKSRLSPVYKPRKTDPKISFEDSLEYFNETGAAKHLLETLNDDPKLFHKVRHIIPQEARLIGTGRIAAAFGVPNSNEVYRVGADVGGRSSGRFSRTDSPLVVQPNKTNRLGPVIVERLPFAQSLHDLGFSRADIYPGDESSIGSRVTGSLLDKFYERAKKTGLKAHDIHSGNIGFLGKRLMAIDPDAVKFTFGGPVPVIDKDIDQIPIQYIPFSNHDIRPFGPAQLKNIVGTTINHLPDFINRQELLKKLSIITLYNTTGPIRGNDRGYFHRQDNSIESILDYGTLAHEMTHAYDYSRFYGKFRSGAFPKTGLSEMVDELYHLDPELKKLYDTKHREYLLQPHEILARGVGDYTKASIYNKRSYAEEVFGRIRKQRFTDGDVTDRPQFKISKARFFGIDPEQTLRYVAPIQHEFDPDLLDDLLYDKIKLSNYQSEARKKLQKKLQEHYISKYPNAPKGIDTLRNDLIEFSDNTTMSHPVLEGLSNKAIRGQLERLLPKDIETLGIGSYGAAVGVHGSNEVYRIGAAKNHGGDPFRRTIAQDPRNNKPLVLPSLETKMVGNLVYERLPFAQTLKDLGLTHTKLGDRLLTGFKSRIEKLGYEDNDLAYRNIGFYKKQLLAIDPDAIIPNTFAQGDSVDNLSIRQRFQDKLRNQRDQKLFGSEIDFGDLLNDFPEDFGNTKQTDKPGLLNKVKKLNKLADGDLIKELEQRIIRLPFEQNFKDSDLITKRGTAKIFSRIIENASNSDIASTDKILGSFDKLIVGQDDKNFIGKSVAPFGVKGASHGKAFYEYGKKFGKTLFPGNIYTTDNPFDFSGILAKALDYSEGSLLGGTFASKIKDSKFSNIVRVAKNRPGRYKGTKYLIKELLKDNETKGLSEENEDFLASLQGDLKYLSNPKNMFKEYFLDKTLDFNNNTLRRMSSQYNFGGPVHGFAKGGQVTQKDIERALKQQKITFDPGFKTSEPEEYGRKLSIELPKIFNSFSSKLFPSPKRILNDLNNLHIQFGTDEIDYPFENPYGFKKVGGYYHSLYGEIKSTDKINNIVHELAHSIDHNRGGDPFNHSLFASEIKNTDYNELKDKFLKRFLTKDPNKDIYDPLNYIDKEHILFNYYNDPKEIFARGITHYIGQKAQDRIDNLRFNTFDEKTQSDYRPYLRRAKGGPIPGYGEGDSVPALLTPKEFVVKKDSAQSVGYSNLRYINEHGKLPGYNKGGIVGMAGGGLFNKEQEFGTVYSKLTLTGRDQLEAELYRANTRLLESLGEEYDNAKKASLANRAFANALNTGDKVITNFAGKIVGLGSIDELVKTRKEVKRTGIEELDTVVNPTLFSRITGKKISKGAVAAGAVGLSLFGPELLRASLGEDKAKDITAGGSGAFAGLYTGGSIGASVGGVQGALVGAILGAITLGLTSYLTSSKNSVAEKQQKDIAEKQANFNEILSNNINKFGLDTKSRSAIVGTQGIISDVEKQAKAKAEEGSFFGLLPFNFSDIGATQNEIERRKKNITLGTLRENTLSGYAPALQNLEKLAQETRVKTGGTAEQRATEFETKLRATGGGAGEQLLTLVASFKSIAEGTLDRKAAEQELLKTLKEEAELRNKNLTLIKTSEDLADKFKDMYNNIGEFTTRLQVVNSKIEDLGGSLGDVLSGQNIKLNGVTQNLLTQPSRFTPDANSPFKESLDRLLEPLGAAGKELGSFILDERRAIAELDPILKSVARTSTARTIEQDIRGGLKQAGVSGITADSVIANLQAMGGAAEGLDKVLINLQTDTTDTINKIKKDLLDFSTPLGQAGQQFDKLNTQIYESATKISAYNDKVREETVRISEITLQQQEVGARRQAERFGGSPLNYISLQAEQEPFRQRVRSLAGTENPQQIGQNIISLSAQLKQLRDNASNLKDETAKLKFADLQTQIRNSEQALRLLANASERSAKIEERLNLLKQQEEGRFDFFKRLVTAKPEELPQLNKEITSANALVQHFNRGGSLDQLPASLRVEGASALAGPFSRFAFRSANNLTGEDILKQFQQRGLPSIGLPAGLLSYNLKERNEKGGLESEQNRVFESAKEAQQQIANIYQNAAQQQQEIFGQSVNIFKDSIAEFSKLLKADADKYKNQPLIEKRTVLTNALGRAPTAEDSELLNSFKRNKERIQEAVSAKGTLESLNKIKDIRSELPNILGKTGEDFDKIALNSSVGTRVAKLTNSSILPTELSEIFENVKKKRLEEIKAQSPLPFTFGLVGGSLDKKTQLQKDFDKNVQNDLLTILQDRLNQLKTDKTSEIDNARNTSGLGSQFDVFIDKFDQFGKVLENVDLNKFNDLISSLKSVPVAETKANGGSIFRPRGTDVVPAMLSPDEYIVNSRSSIANRPLLDRINSAKGPVYLAGGTPVFSHGQYDNIYRSIQGNVSPGNLKEYLSDLSGDNSEEAKQLRKIIKEKLTPIVRKTSTSLIPKGKVEDITITDDPIYRDKGDRIYDLLVNNQNNKDKLNRVYDFYKNIKSDISLENREDIEDLYRTSTSTPEERAAYIKQEKLAARAKVKSQKGETDLLADILGVKKEKPPEVFTEFKIPFRKNSKNYKAYIASQRSIPDYGAYGGPRLPVISSAATGLYPVENIGIPSSFPKKVAGGIQGLPDYVREEMINRGLDPNRPFNDIDRVNPSYRKAIELDPTLTPQQKENVLKTGSPKGLLSKIKAGVPFSDLIVNSRETRPGHFEYFADDGTQIGGGSFPQGSKVEYLSVVKQSTKGRPRNVLKTTTGVASVFQSGGAGQRIIDTIRPPVSPIISENLALPSELTFATSSLNIPESASARSSKLLNRAADLKQFGNQRPQLPSETPIIPGSRTARQPIPIAKSTIRLQEFLQQGFGERIRGPLPAGQDLGFGTSFVNKTDEFRNLTDLEKLASDLPTRPGRTPFYEGRAFRTGAGLLAAYNLYESGKSTIEDIYKGKLTTKTAESAGIALLSATQLGEEAKRLTGVASQAPLEKLFTKPSLLRRTGGLFGRGLGKLAGGVGRAANVAYAGAGAAEAYQAGYGNLGYSSYDEPSFQRGVTRAIVGTGALIPGPIGKGINTGILLGEAAASTIENYNPVARLFGGFNKGAGAISRGESERQRALAATTSFSEVTQDRGLLAGAYRTANVIAQTDAYNQLERVLDAQNVKYKPYSQFTDDVEYQRSLHQSLYEHVAKGRGKINLSVQQKDKTVVSADKGFSDLLFYAQSQAERDLYRDKLARSAQFGSTEKLGYKDRSGKDILESTFIGSRQGLEQKQDAQAELQQKLEDDEEFRRKYLNSIGAGYNQQFSGIDKLNNEFGGANLLFKAEGGSIFKKRGTDTIPAMLSPDEFVVNAASAKANRDILEKINAAKGPIYKADGGFISQQEITKRRKKELESQLELRQQLDSLDKPKLVRPQQDVDSIFSDVAFGKRLEQAGKGVPTSSIRSKTFDIDSTKNAPYRRPIIGDNEGFVSTRSKNFDIESTKEDNLPISDNRFFNSKQNFAIKRFRTLGEINKQQKSPLEITRENILKKRAAAFDTRKEAEQRPGVAFKVNPSDISDEVLQDRLKAGNISGEITGFDVKREQRVSQQKEQADKIASLQDARRQIKADNFAAGREERKQNRVEALERARIAAAPETKIDLASIKDQRKQFQRLNKQEARQQRLLPGREEPLERKTRISDGGFTPPLLDTTTGPEPKQQLLPGDLGSSDLFSRDFLPKQEDVGVDRKINNLPVTQKPDITQIETKKQQLSNITKKPNIDTSQGKHYSITGELVPDLPKGNNSSPSRASLINQPTQAGASPGAATNAPQAQAQAQPTFDVGGLAAPVKDFGGFISDFGKHVSSLTDLAGKLTDLKVTIQTDKLVVTVAEKELLQTITQQMEQIIQNKLPQPSVPQEGGHLPGPGN